MQASSAFGGAGIFIIVMSWLFTRIGGPRAAIAALLTGVIAWRAGRPALVLRWRCSSDG